MRFLIIDDDVDSADVLETFLTQNGHEAVKALSAGDGMEAFRSGNFDAVFLDIVLPDRNGIDLLKEIKKTSQDTPVVMVTGFKDAENVVNAFREGAFDCLLKPFNYEYLKSDIIGRIPLKKK
ncbi:MAG: hypothetical protein A2902_07510 [Elusimicrobia bacterium RIFCSPLOWO2_01_FULL_64_13]|nr:MAG: hypothetical protein A2636_02605 [Elusimicrobia bacterium RIFCSPHIGHO2_01_FULL_64_10]OGR94480.1 MAG: hypothetical protein A2902_07510 [Elusimicrobia bacterium RIFCSPLOWO2_01_FULL_64_13]